MSYKHFQPGDVVVTDYNGKKLVRVKIVERATNVISQSRVMYRVAPALKNGTLDSWYDAAWFKEIEE